MMDSPEICILDVGHGNCALLSDENGSVVIDSPLGRTLLDFLEQREITVIDVCIVSHADADHIGGVLSLLTNKAITVKKLYINPDADKTSKLWGDFRAAARDARIRDGVDINVQLTTSSTPDFDRGQLQLEILAPTPELAMGGVGSTDLQGRPLNSNTMSVVVRIISDGRQEVLLTGDLDLIGLENLLEGNPSPLARVLVFPHHGGRAGISDGFSFAKKLCEAVKPQMVIFSIGRGQYGTPRPEIVAGVRAAVPDAHIACTQLSERCSASPLGGLLSHLTNHIAKGRSQNACCAGTINVSLTSPSLMYEPEAKQHQDFVRRLVPNALCMKENLEGSGKQGL